MNRTYKLTIIPAPKIFGRHRIEPFHLRDMISTSIHTAKLELLDVAKMLPRLRGLDQLLELIRKKHLHYKSYDEELPQR